MYSVYMFVTLCLCSVALQIGEFFGYSMDTVDINGDL